ncbi:hypothetical protein JCGZ_10443 [Jatropha curcas]|uniref:Uncharacterized protein n=1 Tax=Jatropha curcas TaxID=180498 RepID=A0A067KLK1_JATCU|nr:hypothetical protein JCGZ_10443 [Jatropha curcas]
MIILATISLRSDRICNGAMVAASGGLERCQEGLERRCGRRRGEGEERKKKKEEGGRLAFTALNFAIDSSVAKFISIGRKF